MLISVLAEKESIFFRISICSDERKLKKLNAFTRYFLKDEKITWPNDDELDYFISYIEGFKLELAEMRQQECEDMAYRDNVIDEINVENIYYVDNQHQTNFVQLTDHWEKSRIGDKEYLQACYILAVPVLFDKLKDVWNNYEYPTTWMWDYLDGHSDADLSSGMIQLGKLSLNLWNGYKGFNLMDCLSTLDNELYNVAIQAIHIRK